MSVTIERDGQVLVATIDDGKANALSHALIDDLRGLIAQAETDDDVRVVVLAGRPGRFCAGFDLSVIQSGDPHAQARLLADGGDLMRTIYGSSVPVVAACTGHSLAAGALLLLACDRRVGPDAPVKIGLNEVADHDQLEAVALQWAREINGKSPMAQRMLKYAFNLVDDGLVGQQLFAGEATRLAYMTDEAVEGRDAFLEKRDPDWARFPYYY